jgi:hypothetical protein
MWGYIKCTVCILADPLYEKLNEALKNPLPLPHMLPKCGGLYICILTETYVKFFSFFSGNPEGGKS